MSLLRSNLLRAASRIIPGQSIGYRAFTGNTKNAALIEVPSYAAAVPLAANVQAVPRTMYEALGLDLQRNYIIVYASKDLRDVKRDGASDQIDYAGRLYDVESNTDWFSQNGWRGALCVDVGPTP